jgi:hypothetical protein
LAAVFCVTAAGAPACSPAGHARASDPGTAAARDVDAPIERIALGDLTSVDVDRRLVRLTTDEGARLTFGYDDDTEIARAYSAQGLAGNVTRVTVLYIPEPPSKARTGHAVRVVMAR